jgi:hypothetical protein
MLGLKKNIQAAIKERIKRLEVVCLKPPEPPRQQPEFYERWPELKASFQVCQEEEGDVGLRDAFLESVSSRISTTGKDYIAVIQGLAAEESENGVRWLQGIVDRVTSEAQRIVPALA